MQLLSQLQPFMQQANQFGRQAKQFAGGLQNAAGTLQGIAGSDKKKKKIIDYALSQGMSEQDIANYLSGEGLTESQRSDVGRKLKGKERVQALLDTIKTGVKTVAAGYGAYKVAQGLGGLAASVLGRKQAGPLAATILGRASGPTQVPPSQYSWSNPSPGAAGAAATPTPVPPGIQPGGGSAVTPYAPQTPASSSGTPSAAGSIPQQFSQSKKKADLAGLATLAGAKQVAGQAKTPEAKPWVETKKDLAKQLKSSTLRKMNYNSDTKKLELVFNSGAKYQYNDFPEDQWKKLSAGQTPAKTTGKNAFGIWWRGKSPSAGATFNEIIQPQLRKAGPYQYERIGTEEMTPEEEKELAEVQRPLMEKAQKTLSETEKAEKAGRKLKGKEKLNTEQIRARTRVLTKQAEEIRKAPPSERSKKAIDLIEQRLQQMADMDSMTKRVKGKVMREEIERFEKEEAGTFLRKLLVTLPKNIVREAKAKTGRLSERNLLKAIRGLIAK